MGQQLLQAPGQLLGQRRWQARQKIEHLPPGPQQFNKLFKEPPSLPVKPRFPDPSHGGGEIGRRGQPPLGVEKNFTHNKGEKLFLQLVNPTQPFVEQPLLPRQSAILLQHLKLAGELAPVEAQQGRTGGGPALGLGAEEP